MTKFFLYAWCIYILLIVLAEAQGKRPSVPAHLMIYPVTRYVQSNGTNVPGCGSGPPPGVPPCSTIKMVCRQLQPYNLHLFQAWDDTGTSDITFIILDDLLTAQPMGTNAQVSSVKIMGSPELLRPKVALVADMSVNAQGLRVSDYFPFIYNSVSAA